MQNQEGQPIYLSVVLPGSYQTKVPYQDTLPTTANPLHVDVWASTTQSAFKDHDKDGREGEVAIHTAGSFQSGDPQLLAQAVYPPPRQGTEGHYTADPVYFVALHPKDVWSDEDLDNDGNKDGLTAVCTFSGCEDVMFAPEVSGSYDLDKPEAIVTNSPTLKFDHLLTRFTVKMGLELEDGETVSAAQEAWGKVRSLSIKSGLENLNKVTIDLTRGDGFDYGSHVTFSGTSEGSMNFYALGTDAPFPAEDGYELTEQIDSVAYVMCAPVIDSKNDPDYVLVFETEERGSQELEIELRQTTDPSPTERGSTRGNHFVLTLKFKKGRAIASVVNVTQWGNGGFGSGNIED